MLTSRRTTVSMISRLVVLPTALSAISPTPSANKNNNRVISRFTGRAASRGGAFERAAHCPRNPMHGAGADAQLLGSRQYAFPGPQLSLDAFFHLGRNFGLPSVEPFSTARLSPARTRWRIMPRRNTPKPKNQITDGMMPMRHQRRPIDSR
jgi:hypothetical protein